MTFRIFSSPYANCFYINATHKWTTFSVANVSHRSSDRADAKTIPIVAMSANAYMEDVKKCLAAGMNEHVSKPVFKDTLLSALATQMNVK